MNDRLLTCVSILCVLLGLFVCYGFFALLAMLLGRWV